MPETLKEATERLVEAADRLRKLTSKLTGLGLIGFFVKDAAEKRVEDDITAVKAALRREGEKRVFEGEWGWPDLIQERIGGGAYISLNLAKEMMQFDGHRVRITIEKLEDK